MKIFYWFSIFAQLTQFQQTLLSVRGKEGFDLNQEMEIELPTEMSIEEACNLMCSEQLKTAGAESDFSLNSGARSRFVECSIAAKICRCFSAHRRRDKNMISHH